MSIDREDLQVFADLMEWESVLVVRCSYCPDKKIISYKQGWGDLPTGTITDGMCPECKDRIFKQYREDMKNERSS